MQSSHVLAGFVLRALHGYSFFFCTARLLWSFSLNSLSVWVLYLSSKFNEGCPDPESVACGLPCPRIKLFGVLCRQGVISDSHLSLWNCSAQS